MRNLNLSYSKIENDLLSDLEEKKFKSSQGECVLRESIRKTMNLTEENLLKANNQSCNLLCQFDILITANKI